MFSPLDASKYNTAGEIATLQLSANLHLRIQFSSHGLDDPNETFNKTSSIVPRKLNKLLFPVRREIQLNTSHFKCSPEFKEN